MSAVKPPRRRKPTVGELLTAIEKATKELRVGIHFTAQSGSHVDSAFHRALATLEAAQ